MVEKHITQGQVETAYRDYDSAVPGKAGCRNYFNAFPGERRKLRVTIVETPRGALVLTVAEVPIQ